MNLDQEENKPHSTEKTPEIKKLTRKEKKTLKKAAAQAKKTPSPALAKKPVTPQPVTPPSLKQPAAQKPEEVEAKLDPSPVQEIPPPKYTAWEKISPPARRKKQITNMESGYREVLSLVQSMRINQEVLLEAFKKLPEAVDSVKKLADHSAQQSDLLKAMNESMKTGAAGEFNKTLSSMDQTTQLLLERAQRSEERLYSMLRRAQRRIAFMTLMVLMLFLGAVAAGMIIFFPEQAKSLMDKFSEPETELTEVVTPVLVEETEMLGIPVQEIILSESEISPIDQPLNDSLPLGEAVEISEETLPEPVIIDSLPDTELHDLVEEEVTEALDQEIDTEVNPEAAPIEEQAAPQAK